jgi:hypothetical protein
MVRINYKEVCVVTACPFCNKRHEVEVNEIDYLDWQDGVLMAQDAFPYLSADEREMLITGICPTCWDKTFGSDEESDPDDHPIQQGMLGVVDDYALECMEHLED